MQWSRRKTMKIPPVSVVRSSLVFNPVASVVAPQAASFSDVLVKAVSAPRSIDTVYADQEGMQARGDASTDAQTRQANIAPRVAWSPYSKNSTDLYVQLETLLREKSILLAIV